MSSDVLFRPFKLKGLNLPNGIVMAPMTRSFSPGGIPTEDVARYYRRRAEGAVGFIISEGFLGPLVRLSRCEVRDLINCRKSDRWPSYRFYRAWEQLKSPMRYICEIFGSPRFWSFSTQSAQSGP